MRYRVENVYIPEFRGAARLDDDAQELSGRRIIHVIEVRPKGSQGIEARVITEEAPEGVAEQ